MRTLMLAIALLIAGSTAVAASCPFGTRYQCQPVQVGNTVKIVCGCR